jgi:ATP-dependent helicase HrpA
MRPSKDPSSDFLSWLTLWNAFRNQKRHLSGSKLRRWCREKFLSFVRLRESKESAPPVDRTGDVDAGIIATSVTPRPRPCTAQLLAGLLSNIGTKSDVPGECIGARGVRFSIFPARCSSATRQSG